MPRLRARSGCRRLRCGASGHLRRLCRQRRARPLRRRCRCDHLRVRECAGGDRDLPVRAQAGAAGPAGAGDHPGPADRERTSSPASASPPRLLRDVDSPRGACGRARRDRRGRRCSRRGASATTARARSRSATTADPAAAWRADRRHSLQFSKRFVPFEREVSIVAARSPRRPDRVLRPDRERAPRPHPQVLARAGRRARRRRRRGAPHRRSDRDGVRLCRRAGGRDVRGRRRRAARRCWSTRSRRACTIPATGRSTARRCRSSSSISARSPAGRWPSRSGTAGSK